MCIVKADFLVAKPFLLTVRKSEKVIYEQAPPRYDIRESGEQSICLRNALGPILNANRVEEDGSLRVRSVQRPKLRKQKYPQ